MEYINFDAEVRPGGAAGYLVSVRSEFGETSEPVPMAFPFSIPALETHLLKLENAIMRSVGGRRRVRSPEEQSVQELGQALFDFLLADEARSLYYECQREAERKGHGVRLRLRLNAVPELAGLPWEFLYDSRRKDYLCLDPFTPVLRYLDLTRTAAPLVVRPPLRILGMVASPSDLKPLDVAKEKQRVETALVSLQAQGLVQLIWLDGQGWEELQAAMRGGPWHIFHFIGHGQFDRVRDEGMLVFADPQGLAHSISATQLDRLLARQRYSLRLVVINACEGARAGQEDTTSSVAATLAQGGIPAVLAMQYEITDNGAVVFAQSFYKALADGLSIDSAVTDARNAVNLSDGSSLEWGIPVLHMRSTDGRLFEVQADTSQVSFQESPRHARAAEGDMMSTQLTVDEKSKPELETEHSEPIAFDWITVSAGEFLMGSNKDSDGQTNELPEHIIFLPEFCIARVPVTNAQYLKFVQATGHQAPVHWQGAQIPDKKEEYPVVNVSWHDAIAFCAWAKVRLPTEAEWEKAARGNDGRIYPWGNQPPRQDLCNFAEGFGGFFKPFTDGTTAVDAHPLGKSPYGCLDMAGNVWEWTSSLFKEYPYSFEDGREDSRFRGRRVLRGGSFHFDRRHVRCAARNQLSSSYRGNGYGFRVVLLCL